MIMRNPFFITLFVFLFSVQVQASSELYYRYKADNGTTVINDVLPAKYAKRGYSIINKDGMVLEQVAAELTKEQIAKKERLQAIEQKLAKMARYQADLDRQLLSAFASADDIRLTRDRIIKQLKLKVDGLHHSRTDQKKQLDKLLVDAANMERSLGAVSEAVQSSIQLRKQKIAELGELIATATQKVASTEAEYQNKITRFSLLSKAK